MAAWEQLPATGARLAALTGPAGIGKTRLARELEPHLVARGGQSLFAWCYEGGGAPPYWPWGALVRTYLRSAAEAAADAALEGCGEDLAKLVPEVRERLGDRGFAPGSLAVEHEFRFFYAIASFFRNIARMRPLLLLIDDVHWADASALRLLAFLVRELRDAPVLVVVTLRDDGETQTSALQRVWGAVRGPASIALQVGPLGASDVTKLVAARLGDDFDLGLVPALAERSEGNPLFLIELVRAVESAAVPAAADAIARLVPKAIQGVVLERLERLSPSCVALVRLAAVPCRELSLGQLRRAAGADIDAAVEEAFAKGILTDHGERSGYLCFRHALIPEVVRSQLGPVERLALQRRWLRALEHEEDLDAVAGELAEHAMALARAGGEADAEVATAHATRAGEVALRAFAHAEAARHFERALEAAARWTTQDARRRAALHLAAGEAFRRAARPDAARAAIERARALAREAGDHDLLARAALARAPGFFASAGAEDLGGRLESSSYDPDLIAALDEALARVAPDRTQLRARLLARRAIAGIGGVDERERVQMSEQALALAEQSGDPLTLAYALGARHSTLGRPEDFEARRALVARMRALGSLAEDLELSLMQRLFWIAILLEAGDVRAADREIDACTRYARELRLPRSRLYAESYRAMRDVMRGEYPAARVAIHGLLAEAEDAGDTAGSFMLRLRLALVDAEVASDNVERASDLMHTGLRAHPQMKFFQAGLARSLLDAGRLEDAQRELDRIAGHDFADIPCSESFGLTHALLAEVAASLRDRERSARLYQILRPAAGRFVVIVFAAAVFGSVDRLLGRLAHVCGQLDLARAHFEAALALERDAGARPALAHTLHDHAVLLADCADPAARELAARQLADAQGLACTLDMQRLAGQIARTLAQHPELAAGALAQSAPAPSREEPGPRGVFEREGDYWTLAYAGEVVRVRDLRGLGYLAALLVRPHDSIPALDLIAEVGPQEIGAGREAPAALSGDAGELLDGEARRAYVARLRELSAELEQARDDGDLGRAERLAAESELLQQELSRAFGLAGRARVAGSAAERARVSVTRAIRKAIDQVERVHPALGKHLRQSVRTGRLCSYEPTLDTAPGWKI